MRLFVRITLGVALALVAFAALVLVLKLLVVAALILGALILGRSLAKVAGAPRRRWVTGLTARR